MGTTIECCLFFPNISLINSHSVEGCCWEVGIKCLRHIGICSLGEGAVCINVAERRWRRGQATRALHTSDALPHLPLLSCQARLLLPLVWACSVECQRASITHGKERTATCPRTACGTIRKGSEQLQGRCRRGGTKKGKGEQNLSASIMSIPSAFLDSQFILARGSLWSPSQSK